MCIFEGKFYKNKFLPSQVNVVALLKGAQVYRRRVQGIQLQSQSV
ncbi:hypothetical protein ACP70R_039961 [Stipagrostis hirtigluma subsp. patula]